MKIISIRKKSGGVRKIYVPDSQEKQKLRELLTVIPQPADKLISAHGFWEGRSPVTNAVAHCKNYTHDGHMISMDLSDFFGRVTAAQVNVFLPSTRRGEIVGVCFPGGAAQQGLPTSPALANLAGIAIDEAIRRKIKKCQWNCIYTRYVDDLSLSFPALPGCGIDKIINDITDIVTRCGHKINAQKTRVQTAKSGRWECCGVMIDADGVHISRRQRRQLRALEYNAAKSGADKKIRSRARGLREWAKLKTPITPEERRAREKSRTATKRDGEARVIASECRIDNIDTYHAITPDIYLPGGAIITQDPVMIYGMSVYTTGWTSCMDARKRGYDYYEGVEFWRRLRGISIAYMPDSRKMTWCGVIRPKMRERALIYSLRDGRKCYGIIYPAKTDSGYRLGKILRNAGYLPASDCRATG